MKTKIITLACILVLLNVLCYQAIAQQKIGYSKSTKSNLYQPFYLGLYAQIAIPQGSVKEYSKTRGGVRIEVGKPFKANPSFSAGMEISGIFSNSKKDTFKGIEVETSTTLTEIHPFMRWTPKKDFIIKPYVTVSTGIMIASTETTSQIVDEATFLEQVLYDQNDHVETVTHKKNKSSNFSYNVGAGFIIKKVVMVGVQYQHSNPINYVDHNTVKIKDNTIQYDAKRISLDMLVISIGVKFDITTKK